jgi:hypothetical protein
VYVHNFAHGQKAICYLGALAIHHGTESFDWFTRNMPDNVALVDGMEADLDDQEWEGRERASSERSQGQGLAKAHLTPFW